MWFQECPKVSLRTSKKSRKIPTRFNLNKIRTRAKSPDVFSRWVFHGILWAQNGNTQTTCGACVSWGGAERREFGRWIIPGKLLGNQVSRLQQHPEMEHHCGWASSYWMTNVLIIKALISSRSVDLFSQTGVRLTAVSMLQSSVQ